jgi:hypothetical protein
MVPWRGTCYFWYVSTVNPGGSILKEFIFTITTIMNLSSFIQLPFKVLLLLLFAVSIVQGAPKKESSALARGKNPYKYIIFNGVAATPEAFQEIVTAVGKPLERKKPVGVGFIISYLNQSPEAAATTLKKFLALSEQFEMPIIVQLDGEQWWGARPDLWNWWDPNKPGYNPNNKANVEWTSWSAESAVKIGWRNWGRQLRVLPMPNLMSPAYRQANHIELKKLVPIVMDWYQGLPKKKKYLLVGLKVGWESAIGVNNWYYPNGNDLLQKPEKEDPQYGLKNNILPSRGVQAIGYAAVSTQGLAKSGELSQEQVTEVVRLHLEDLCKTYAELGVPRSLMFTHCGGWSPGEALYSAAVNKYSNPGWSFYDYAYDPKKDLTAMKVLEGSDAPYWGAVEWLFMGKKTQQQWLSALEETLSHPKVKYMNIYNWASIKDNPDALGAIRQYRAK